MLRAHVSRDSQHPAKAPCSPARAARGSLPAPYSVTSSKGDRLLARAWAGIGAGGPIEKIHRQGSLVIAANHRWRGRRLIWTKSGRFHPCSTHVSLLPPPCEEFTTSEPRFSATRVNPPGRTLVVSP